MQFNNVRMMTQFLQQLHLAAVKPRREVSPTQNSKNSWVLTAATPWMSQDLLYQLQFWREPASLRTLDHRDPRFPRICTRRRTILRRSGQATVPTIESTHVSAQLYNAKVIQRVADLVLIVKTPQTEDGTIHVMMVCPERAPADLPKCISGLALP